MNEFDEDGNKGIKVLTKAKAYLAAQKVLEQLKGMQQDEI